MPKRNTYLSSGDFFWAKQEENETPEKHWRELVSGNSREQLIREKTMNLKTTMDLVFQAAMRKDINNQQYLQNC